MSGTALPIGEYQLNNLITGRLTFIILTLDIDFAEVYGGVELQHARNYGVGLDIAGNLQEQAVAALNERHFPKNGPVIVVCKDGKKSKELADYLDGLGYINSFYLLDGFEEFKKSNAQA